MTKRITLLVECNNFHNKGRHYVIKDIITSFCGSLAFSFRREAEMRVEA